MNTEARRALQEFKTELTKGNQMQETKKTRRPIKRMPIADRKEAVSMYRSGGYTYAGLANHFDVSVWQIQQLLGKPRTVNKLKKIKTVVASDVEPKIKESVNYKSLYLKAVAKLVEHGLAEVSFR